MVIHTNICTNENYSPYDTIKLYLYGLDHRYHIVSLLSKVNDSMDTFCTQDLTFIHAYSLVDPDPERGMQHLRLARLIHAGIKTYAINL